ncbi:radical SAM protein [bacterium]|nr:radical SAM protein [bacterium]
MYFDLPFELYLDLTAACNLNCSFCMRNWKPYLRHKDRRDLIPYLKSELLKNRIPGIILTGGEPLLHPEFLPFVKFLKQNGMKVKITSNGTLLNKNMISQLKDLDVDEIQVSLHTFDKRRSLQLYGKRGVVGKVWEALELLSEYEVPFSTKTTITSVNAGDIDFVIRKVLPLSPYRMKFTEVFMMGSAFLKHVKKPSIQDLHKISELITGMDDGRLQFQSESLSYEENGYPTICSLGDKFTTSMEILSDGTVLPCAYGVLFDEQINIFDLGIKGAWENLEIYSKYKKMPEGCAACSMSETCMGGCPARRGLYKMERDPVCKKGIVYEKEMV